MIGDQKERHTFCGVVQCGKSQHACQACRITQEAILDPTDNNLLYQPRNENERKMYFLFYKSQQTVRRISGYHPPLFPVGYYFQQFSFFLPNITHKIKKRKHLLTLSLA